MVSKGKETYQGIAVTLNAWYMWWYGRFGRKRSLLVVFSFRLRFRPPLAVSKQPSHCFKLYPGGKTFLQCNLEHRNWDSLVLVLILLVMIEGIGRLMIKIHEGINKIICRIIIRSLWWITWRSHVCSGGFALGVWQMAFHMYNNYFQMTIYYVNSSLVINEWMIYKWW